MLSSKMKTEKKGLDNIYTYQATKDFVELGVNLRLRVNFKKEVN